MKICSRCKSQKLFSDFYKSKSTKTGYQAYCKGCSRGRAEYLKNYREVNKDTLSLKQKEYQEKNKDKYKLKSQEYYLENKSIYREKGRQHYIKNKAVYLHYSKQRKLLLSKAMPKWLSKEMRDQIKDFYVQARQLSEQTEISYHVDHIIPLNGENVCGLHVPWNLQILTAQENLRKSNKYE